MEKILFTSESVTSGHPDKICDQISDAILDEILRQDPNGHVACETVCTTGMVLIMGEITANAKIDAEEIARNTINEIGYNKEKYGFDDKSCEVIVKLDKQSSDISQGVNKSSEQKTNDKNNDEFNLIGAGDQGIMFGYACDDTDAFMPYPIYLANKIAFELNKLRENKVLPYLRPDGKTQVTMEYDENGNPFRVEAIVISTQHDENVETIQIKEDLLEHLVFKIIPRKLIDSDTKFFVNPTGRFVIGGPVGDSGLTGRKIIVDTYGGFAKHGGGAFSGKDPTKVDRSAAYMARYVAKNIVASGIAKKCEIQVSYAIGMATPMSIHVDTFGTGKISDEMITSIVRKHFDFRPAAIIDKLDLKKPIYKKTAAYGHFGREDIDLPWEKLDKVEDLKKEIS